MIQALDLAWAAGFLEGEACFTASRHVARIDVTQVEPHPLARLRALFGGSIRYYNRNKRPTHRPYGVWTLQGPMGTGLMMTLYPLMSPTRQAQIRKAIAVWKAAPTGHKFKVSCVHGHRFDQANTLIYLNPNRGTTQRMCRTCIADRLAKLRMQRAS